MWPIETSGAPSAVVRWCARQRSGDLGPAWYTRPAVLGAASRAERGTKGKKEGEREEEREREREKEREREGERGREREREMAAGSDAKFFSTTKKGTSTACGE